ncbi:MAG: hypothetical protein J6U38_09135 [Clostridia bacterium]|nr:hypothetical protein [Clostridia bacterium]MBO7659474.1 hypothetical protein [Clostridia bacterium]MBP5766509.1 hypothetical protein [Clostridia bacterium]
MKKLIAILTLIAVTFMFTACDLSSLFDFSTQAPSETPSSQNATGAPEATEDPAANQTPQISPPPSAPPTEPPVTETPEPDYMKEFFDNHKGYWTEEDGKFITFSEEGGKYYAMFAIWNAGGPFPAGEVTKVAKAGDGLYFLTCLVSTDGSEKKEYTFSVIDNADTDPRSIDCTIPGETVQRRYYNHTEAAFPSFFTERAIADFVSKYAGYWTAIDGNFFQITDEGSVFFAIWNAGGPFPGGKISNVYKSGDQYNVTVDISAVAPNDENSGWSAYTFYLSFEDIQSNPDAALANHPFEVGITKFYRHSQPGYPEFFNDMIISDFVEQYQGYWTDMDGKFFYVSPEGNMSFAIWNAGGPFPAGKIKYASTDGQTYYLTIAINAVAANDENDGWAAYDYNMTFTEQPSTKPTAKATHPFNYEIETFYHHTSPGMPFNG